MAAPRSFISHLSDSPLRNLAYGLTYILVLIAAATAAYIATGWSATDAFYMVIITVFTIGYGEVHPIDSFDLHAITIATIVLGWLGITFLAAAFVQSSPSRRYNNCWGRSA